MPDWLVMGHAVNGLAMDQTRDGFHEGLQIHYLSRILLTRLLIDTMCEQSRDPRIMTLLGTIDYDRVMGGDKFMGHILDDKGEGRFELRQPQGGRFRTALDGWMGLWQRGKAYQTAAMYTDLAFHRLAKLYPALAVVHADLPVTPHKEFAKALPAPLRQFTRGLAAIHPSSKPAEEAAAGIVTTFLSSAPGFHLVDKDGNEMPLGSHIKEGKAASDYVWRRTLGLLELSGWREEPGWKERGEPPEVPPPGWDMSLDECPDLEIDMRKDTPPSMPPLAELAGAS